MTSTGVDTTRGFALLSQVGWTQADIAAQLRVPAYSVARWAAGHLPPARALTALRGLVAQLAMAEYAAPELTRNARLLEAAADALRSDADRAELEDFDAAMRSKRAAIVAQREQQRAELGQLADAIRRSQRPARVSITRSVDPLALVGRDREMALAEGAF